MKIQIKGRTFEAEEPDEPGELRVGSKVRVLKKKYDKSYDVFPGIVVGFDLFENLPSAVVMYAEVSYSGAELKWLTFNDKTEDVELAAAQYEDKDLPTIEEAMQVFERQEAELVKKIDELREKRDFFRRKWGTAYGVVAPPVPETAE